MVDSGGGKMLIWEMWCDLRALVRNAFEYMKL